MKQVITIGTLTLMLGILITAISGCSKIAGIEGNGSIITETRMTVSFNEIDNQDEFEVYCIPDTVFKVVIEAESNLEPHIRTIVNGGTLEIDTRENLKSNYAMKVYVHSPVLQSVHLSGSGIISTGSIEEEEFEVTISGSGIVYGSAYCNYFRSYISGSGQINFNIESQVVKSVISGSGYIELDGVAYSGDYRISGSGNIWARSLYLTECIADISGSGNINTSVSDYLQAEISGSGNIYYYGDPVIDSHISGSGNIIKQ